MNTPKPLVTGHHLSTHYCTCGCRQFQFHVADANNNNHAGVAYSVDDAIEACHVILQQLEQVRQFEHDTYGDASVY